MQQESPAQRDSQPRCSLSPCFTKKWDGLNGNSVVPSHGCKSFLLHIPECDSGTCMTWRKCRVHSHLFLLIYKTRIPMLLSVKGCRTIAHGIQVRSMSLFIAFSQQNKMLIEKLRKQGEQLFGTGCDRAYSAIWIFTFQSAFPQQISLHGQINWWKIMR